MLTKNEITTLNLSPTKKDFVQIWNELLEVAGRLSERWDPTSTNESDPGIVILKALTGIADKLNYNIDKNILEAFMPTAAQEDSMRKLCDMLGYNVKYYRSAETTVNIKYYNAEPSDDEKAAMDDGLIIPKFTVITNSDQDINYFTTNQSTRFISLVNPTAEGIPCMEGQIVKCESTADNNVITSSQISDGNRFYMPEYQIAENGIFVYNVAANQEDGEEWEKVDNLNIQARGSRVFKFGFDSYEGRPYIEFPEDYSELIKDGLFIYYARTSGANGNVSPRTLTQLEIPNLAGWDKVSAESFSVENAFSATTGANIETINQAYNSFKKTVGTFETLVTCRDYMNKIYQMTNESTGKYLVSNALATDIRTDLNRAITICSCDDAGIFYKDTPLTITTTKTLKKSGTGEEVEVEDEESAINHFDLVLYPFKAYNQIRNNVKDIQEVYDSSFRYDPRSTTSIVSRLDEFKTIAHNLKSAAEGDITSINNYLRLNAIIGTTSKITAEEGVLLVEKIKIALANAFNMRELDFGEEIPFDSILSVIENADARINVVSLAEPALYTTFSVYKGLDTFNNPIIQEYAVASEWLTETYVDASDRFDYIDTANKKYTRTFDTAEAKKIYNKLAVRNILAGRVPLFKYNNTFTNSFSDGAYRITEELAQNEFNALPTEIREILMPREDRPFTIYVADGITYTGQLIVDESTKKSVPKYTKTYIPEVHEGYLNNIITKHNLADDDINFTKITTSCKIKSDLDSDGQPTKHISDVTLADGEYIKFRAPNFTTKKTYPAYVNYHLKLNETVRLDSRYAEAYTLYSLLTEMDSEGKGEARRNEVFEYFEKNTANKKTFTLIQTIPANTSKTSNDITININNKPTTETPSQILAKSGFVKLVSGKAKVSADSIVTLPEIFLTLDSVTTSRPAANMATSYIINADVFDAIKQITDTALIKLADNELPKVDWTVSYDFEYIPFDQVTLAGWENFIKLNIARESLFGFKPIIEYEAALWRIVSGNYQKGKYILDAGMAKVLPFNASYFGSLNVNRLNSIYILKDLGRDAEPNYINNDEEYMLRTGEYLYIEYTPSTTAEDGTSQSAEPVTEILPAGTIIKPSGFTGEGLTDSTVYEATGKSTNKTVNFGNVHGEIGLYSLGASEQIAVRELAKVELSSNTLFNSPNIYIYKNFNDCEALETVLIDPSSGERVSYTLGDGEYIFYTDKNKAEFAYFTSGTSVTLTGNFVLPRCEIIDIATIFDSGIQAIPWVPKAFSYSDGITFQEFQYITLGPKDTLTGLNIVGSATELSEKWQSCDNVTYLPAGAEEVESLSKINIVNAFSNGNGWEASSTFVLNTSPDNYQTLRNTDKVETSLTIYKESSTGSDDENGTTPLKALDETHPISFKTNLSCQTSNNTIEIDNIYSNPNNIKSFELKVFAEQPPAIIKTAPGKLIPLVPDASSTITDITTAWTANSEKMLASKGVGELWTRVPLTYLANTETDGYDNALRLSISVLPNTYGIFCVYVRYNEDEYKYITDLEEENKSDYKPEIWLNLLPGTSTDDIALLNVDEEDLGWEVTPDYLRLKLNLGINCIRVNKTCDLFVKAKTTSATTNTLYFDDLKLVDCQPIEYIEDGEKKLQQTQGLNIAQIGYLDTSGTNTFNKFDQQIRKKRKEDAVNIALTALNDRAKKAILKQTSYLDELQTSKADLQALVSFLTNAKIELSNLKDESDETIKALIEKYKEISQDLEREKELKNALDNNKNIDDLEQQLISLLERFGNTETAGQDLLEELDALEQAANTKIGIFTKDILSKGAILDDFEAVAASTDTQLINELKLVCLRENDVDYANKLAVLETAVSAISTDEARNGLLALLENLNTSKYAELINQVQLLVNSNQEALKTTLAGAQSIAAGTYNTESNRYEVDYASLLAVLVNLHEQLSSADIEVLLSQTEVIANSTLANSDKYAELSSRIEKLSKLLNNTSEGSYKAVIVEVDKLITIVESALNSGGSAESDSAVRKGIKALDISSAYDSQLKTLLEQTQEILNELKSNYTDTMNSLRASEDTAVQAILRKLTEYNNVRITRATDIEKFGTEADFNIREDYLTLPYGTIAVISIWPDYMKRDYVEGLNDLYKDIREVINKPNSGITLSRDKFYAGETKDIARQTLVAAANFGTFQQLFERAKGQGAKETQISERSEFINQLSDLIPASISLNSAEYNEKQAVIKRLIEELNKKPSITEKQRLVAELKAELDATILFDTQLVEISAKLLWPSILLFPEYNIPGVETDFSTDFFDRLKAYLSEQKDELLELESGFKDKLSKITEELNTAYKVINNISTAVTARDFSQFTQWDLIEPSDESSTLLVEEYLNKLKALKDTIYTQNLIVSLKKCQLLTILQNRDLKVAWHVNGTWMDGAGNSLDNTADIDMKRDNTGNWKDNAGNDIVINIDENEDLDNILSTLLDSVRPLGEPSYISESFKEAHNILSLELQLLQNIKDLDRNREFYYNVPIEANVAIDFNEGEAKLNTLMNPAVNYDINNVNNNFVISKIDINYLTNGLQIARSSKIS